VDEVRDALAAARAEDAPWRVIGRGSNLVVEDDGVDGWVLDLRRLRSLTFGDDGLVVAGAGLNTAVLLGAARRRGLGGLECLVGYPATVGGAVRMNAGGRWGYVGAVVESVVVVAADGVVRELDQAACGFAYRTSALAAHVIVEARLRLPRVDVEAYRAAVEEIHAEKAARQPLQLPSAGCMFRNPDGVSAGLLVDRAGLKGRARGGAQVSEIHGNFVVNRGGASASDVLGLVDEVRAEVARVHGVELRLEVEVWRRGRP
jgi:UDP-N-acetylmuramate dehydrogenase